VETTSAQAPGYVLGVDARRVGEIAVLLGAGRARKGDPVDHAVGLVVQVKVGDRVETGQALFTIHANDGRLLADARQQLLAAISWSEAPVQPLPLFYGIVC
jgi:pyrimidine-nucleoside phosphorylase